MNTAWVDYLAAGGGAAVALLGVVVLLLALFRDRARGRRRCPKCWYDMKGVPGRTCPECGRTAKRERRLFRTRRRWRRAALGALLVLVGGATTRVPDVRRRGWLSVVPTPVLMYFVPPAWDDEYMDKASGQLVLKPVAAEMGRRAGREQWSGWEWRTLLQRAEVIQMRRAHAEGEWLVVEGRIPEWLGILQVTFCVRAEGEDEPLVRPRKFNASEPGGVARVASRRPVPAGAQAVVCDVSVDGRRSFAGSWNVALRDVPGLERSITPASGVVLDAAVRRALDVRVYPAVQLHHGLEGVAACLWVDRNELKNERGLGIGAKLELMKGDEVVETCYAGVAEWDGTFPASRSVPADFAVFHRLPVEEAFDEAAQWQWTIRVRGAPFGLLTDLGKNRYWSGEVTLALRDLVIRPGTDGPGKLWKWTEERVIPLRELLEEDEEP